MAEPIFRALVVDDEPVARRVVMYALSQEGFICDPAADGLEAMEKLAQTQYDLLVTDLLMPNRHGHALSTCVLEQRRNGLPVVVVHTTVDNPRLAKDLILRGVDDIVYKPAIYEAFAAKMRAMVKRQRARCALARSKTPSAPPPQSHDEQVAPASEPPPRLNLEEFDRLLSQIHHILPVSEVAVEVVHRVREDDCDARSLAELIQRDIVLATELLRLVNNGFYNRAGRKITELHEAIARVGIKRIGEISLAVSTLKGLAKIVLPWFDKELTHARSLAGCLMADRLLKNESEVQFGQGIVFSALIYPLARLVVASAAPQLYERMLEECQRSQQPLADVERRTLPRSLTEALVRLISRWGLPADLYAPLAHMDLPPAEQSELPEPLRAGVNLLQQAVRLGEFAVGRWLPWEAVDLVRPSDLVKIPVDSLAAVIEEARSELAGTLAATTTPPNKRPTRLRVPYVRFSPAGFDFGRVLLASMEVEIQDTAASLTSIPPGSVVNAVDATSEEQAYLREHALERKWTVWLRGAGQENHHRSAHAPSCFVFFPTSYRALFAASTAHFTPSGQSWVSV